MAERTEIPWADGTFNGWIGCTKVSPGCVQCYAEADFDHRKHRAEWGPGKPRIRTSADNWNKPKQWNRKHAEFYAKHVRRRRVFCASLGDVFDPEVPEEWRTDLWELIRQTPNLDWLLLTKRADRIVEFLPEDWGKGYDNVWLGVTVENKKHGLPRVDILREIPAKVRFLSCEPLLEDLGAPDLTGIHWVIAGGESGPRARPMAHEWVHGIYWHCYTSRVAFFFKQWGGPGRDKGGCLLGGRVEKHWPIVKNERE